MTEPGKKRVALVSFGSGITVDDRTARELGRELDDRGLATEVVTAFDRRADGRFLRELAGRADAFDAFVFLPCAEEIVAEAATLVAERALIHASVSDERIARRANVETAIHAARGLLFTSDAERDRAEQFYGPGLAWKSTVVGELSAAVPATPAARIGNIVPAAERYVLYLGPRERSAQFDLVIESFRAHRQHDRSSNLKLFLAGPGEGSFSDARRGIVDLGDVTEPERSALLEHARVSLQPSTEWRYPRDLIEAWSHGTPTIASRLNAAAVSSITASGGGWLATTKSDWTRLIGIADAAAENDLRAAGARGRRYADDIRLRARVVDRYARGIERAIAARAPARREIRPYLAEWDILPHLGVLDRLADGKLNLLYAGPLDEPACLEQLVAAFAFLLSFGADARLVIAGSFEEDGSLSERVFRTISAGQLDDRVIVLEGARQDVMAACYRSADLFWSMAEDGGPYMNLFDALAFSIPVCAYASDVARDVVGGAGVLFSKKDSLIELAALALVTATDSTLRATLVANRRA